MRRSDTRSPARDPGLLDAMIGAGILVLTGLAADIAGPAAVLVFGLTAS